MQQFSEFFVNYLRPIIDIIVLAIIFFESYKLLARNQAVQLLRGAFILAIVYSLAFFLKLNTVLWILNALAPGLVIGLAIIFQPELRRIFMQLGQGRLFKKNSRIFENYIDAAITAIELLATIKRGALIVFTLRDGIKNILETGTTLQATVSSNLILSIFSTDTPLHDGALVIHEGRIEAAGCFLPLSEQQDIRKSFGSRHRAALGLSEISDAIVLIVSEETGALSYAYESKLYYELTLEQIRKKLFEIFGIAREVYLEDKT